MREHGEESAQTVQALSNVDQQIRKIQEEMNIWNLHESTNLIVLSDHGLMAVKEEDQFFIEECLADFAKIKQVANSLSFAMIWPEEGEEVGSGQQNWWKNSFYGFRTQSSLS